MYYLLLISFLSLIIFITVVNLPNNKFNISGKKKKLSIEILWCYLGGLLLVVLTELFKKLDHGSGYLDIGHDLFNSRRWDGNSYDFGDEFIFGFIITAIIIWSVKLYKRIK